MKVKEYVMLLTLAATWGASFLFIKIAAPEFGPILTANLRVGIAAITLAVVLIVTRTKFDFIENWKKYTVLGLLNAAIPFVLICTAELHISASLASILNAATPTFTAITAVLWNKEKLTIPKLLGLILGFVGVTVLVGWNSLGDSTIGLYATFSIFAAVSYGIAGVYSAKTFTEVKPLNIAFGQQVSATIMLLPLSLVNLPSTMPSGEAIMSIMALAVVCTALAYILFFHLIKAVGAVKTLLVTFLVPVFGIVWGSVFLSEHISVQNVVGLTVITLSIVLINKRGKSIFVKQVNRKNGLD
ncbi:MAG: DMT family transporter [Bacilli bacterium]